MKIPSSDLPLGLG